MATTIPDLDVKIISPQETIWEGKVSSVSSANSKGPFDILPLHANFITIIENKPIKLKIKNESKEFSFSRAVLFAHENHVAIYINI